MVPTIGKSVTLMHRDTKLGLALAILVMGFAAALCFPREPGEQRSSDDLTLQSAGELDAGIRLGQVKVHTDADRPKPRIPVATPDEPQRTADPESEVLPVVTMSEPSTRTHDLEPTPINPASLPPEVIAEPEPVVHTRTYTVRPNDTLTGIALRELGSDRKWGELLEANRELLPDPHALRPGMVLVIPIPEGDEATPTRPAASPLVSSSPVVTPNRAEPTRPEPAANRPSGRFRPTNRIGSATTPKLQ